MGEQARGPRSALPPYFSASGLLSKPPRGGPGGEPNPSPSPSPSRHACPSLCVTMQLDFEPLRRFVSVPHHHHRDMSTSRVEWLGPEVVCACISSFNESMGEFWRSRTVRSFSAGRTLAGQLVSCLRAFQNVLGAFRNAITHATLRRAPRGRPGLAGCLPRCVRADGRAKFCAKIVPALVEPHTFVQ